MIPLVLWYHPSEQQRQRSPQTDWKKLRHLQQGNQIPKEIIYKS